MFSNEVRSAAPPSTSSIHAPTLLPVINFMLIPSMEELIDGAHLIVTHYHDMKHKRPAAEILRASSPGLN